MGKSYRLEQDWVTRTKVQFCENSNRLHKYSKATQFREILLPNESQCQSVNTSQIGIAYIFLPNRFYPADTPIDQKDQNVFTRTNFYSLLLLTRLFKPSPTNQLLFYYVNSTGQPRSNHYNRWISDPFWKDKIGLDNIKFIELNYNATETDTRFIIFRLVLRGINRENNFRSTVEKQGCRDLLRSEVIPVAFRSN